MKFQASNHLEWLYSPVCVGPGRKPQDRFSYNEAHLTICQSNCLGQHSVKKICYFLKDADKLCIDHRADQRLCFHYIDSIPLLPKSVISSCGCTAQFVSDPIENPEDRFWHDVAYDALSSC